MAGHRPRDRATILEAVTARRATGYDKRAGALEHLRQLPARLAGYRVAPVSYYTDTLGLLIPNHNDRAPIARWGNNAVCGIYIGDLYAPMIGFRRGNSRSALFG